MKAIMHNRLKVLRKGRGLTLAELADLVGVAHATVHRWETGVRPFDTRDIPLLCRHLKCRPGQLFEPDGHGIKHVLSGAQERALDVLTILTPENRAAWFRAAIPMLDPGLLLANVPASEHDRVYKTAIEIAKSGESENNITTLNKRARKSDPQPG